MKAPFGLYQHHHWFDKHPYVIDAVDEFIQQIMKRDDVWIITMYQFVQWMQNPTPLSKLKDFEPWKTACKRPAVKTKSWNPVVVGSRPVLPLSTNSSLVRSIIYNPNNGSVSYYGVLIIFMAICGSLLIVQRIVKLAYFRCMSNKV